MSDVITAARAEGRLLLNEVEAKAMLAEAGVPVTETRLARSVEEAVALADALGYPAALKIVSADIAHKSDVGGVVLGLADAAAVRQAHAAMLARVAQAAPGARIDGVSVQRMAAPGIEVIVGGTTDPQFGPVLMFGLGGVFVEVLKDVAFRIVPLEPRDAAQMIREINALPVLQGARGAAPADLGAIEAMLLGVSAFMAAHPEVAELDLNPVFAYAEGAVAVDARIVLAAPGEERGAL
ncbi:MAG: acetate--CoA ligase family protein [Dehalococcoidia bacterium]